MFCRFDALTKTEVLLDGRIPPRREGLEQHESIELNSAQIAVQLRFHKGLIRMYDFLIIYTDFPSL